MTERHYLVVMATVSDKGPLELLAQQGGHVWARVHVSLVCKMFFPRWPCPPGPATTPAHRATSRALSSPGGPAGCRWPDIKFCSLPSGSRCGWSGRVPTGWLWALDKPLCPHQTLQ